MFVKVCVSLSVSDIFLLNINFVGTSCPCGYQSTVSIKLADISEVMVEDQIRVKLFKLFKMMGGQCNVLTR